MASQVLMVMLIDWHESCKINQRRHRLSLTGIYTALPHGDGFQRACSAYYQENVLGTKILTSRTDPVPQSLLYAAFSTTPGHTPVPASQV